MTYTPEKKRFDLVDALRGFAILGIMLLHSIEHFNFYTFPDDAGQSEWMLAMNSGIWDTMFFIFGSKAYGIFAILFGFTFHLQFTKQARQNIDFGPRFLWRMVLLFGFGWINSILFPGEILLLYAVLAPSLLLVRKRCDLVVLILAIFFLLQPMELYYTVRALLNPTFELPNYRVGYYWNQTMEYMREGSFISMIKHSYIGAQMTFLWSLGNGRIFQTIGLFIMGLYLGRKSLFNNSEKSTKVWRTILFISLPLFLFLLFIQNSWLKSAPEHVQRTFGIVLNAWKNLAQLAAMVSLFCILFYLKGFRKITKPLNAYGRMSLSNYMMQSVVGGLLFYPYALNLAEKVNVTYSLLMGFGMLVVFIVFCNWWIKKFGQGPMEKLWHRLTWLKLRS